MGSYRGPLCLIPKRRRLQGERRHDKIPVHWPYSCPNSEPSPTARPPFSLASPPSITTVATFAVNAPSVAVDLRSARLFPWPASSPPVVTHLQTPLATSPPCRKTSKTRPDRPDVQTHPSRQSPLKKSPLFSCRLRQLLAPFPFR